jgi:hypothetical protein
MERMAKGGKVKKFSFGGDAEGDPGEGIGGVDHETQNDARSGNDQGQGPLGYDDHDFGGRGGVSPDAGSVDWGGFDNQLSQERADLGGLSYDHPDEGSFGGYDSAEFGGAQPSRTGWGGQEAPGLGIGASGTSMGLDGLGGRSRDEGPLGYAGADFPSNPRVEMPDLPDVPEPGRNASAGLNPGYGPGMEDLDPVTAATMAALAIPQPDDVPYDVYRESLRERPRNADMLQTRAHDEALRDKTVGQIAKIETGWLPADQRYSTPGPLRNGDRAYGFSQVMGKNVPGWSEEYYGSRMVGPQYQKDPYAQTVTTNGAVMADLLGGKFNAQGIREIPDFGMAVERGKERTPSPAEVAHDWIGHGVSDGITKSADYASRVGSGVGSPGSYNPGNVVAGDAIPSPSMPEDLRDYDPYANAVNAAPGKAASGWQQDVWDDPTSYGGTPASRAPTSFEQYYNDDPAMPAPDYREASLFDQAPYGMRGASGLGFDPISRNSSPGVTLRDLTVAGDAVPTDDYTGTKSHAPKAESFGPTYTDAVKRDVSNFTGMNPDATYPNHGVVAQPPNPMHSYAATGAGALIGAAHPVAGAIGMGLGALGMMGYGPGGYGSILGNNSRPGIDLSRGQQNEQGGMNGGSDNAYNSGAQLAGSHWSKPSSTQPSNSITPPKPTSNTQVITPDYKPSKVHIPDGDMTKYGYGTEGVFYKEGGQVSPLASRVQQYKRLLDSL